MIRTNQRSLLYLWDQTIATEVQQKWLVKLMGYDFIIEYKKGRENSAADSLSRPEEGTHMEHEVSARHCQYGLTPLRRKCRMSLSCRPWLKISKLEKPLDHGVSSLESFFTKIRSI